MSLRTDFFYRNENVEFPSRIMIGGWDLHCRNNLRFPKAGVQKPHAGADVSDQDDVDCKLNCSHFTNVVAEAVLQVCEETRNLRNRTEGIKRRLSVLLIIMTETVTNIREILYSSR